MGTRGYIGIHSAKDNFFRGIYNHYDSYPTGLGEDIKKTVKDFQETELLFHLKNTKIVNEADECPSDILAKMKEKRSNGEEGFWRNVSSGSDWYSALSGCQGDFAKYAEAGYFAGDDDYKGSFMEDSLFCEWAYIIDLDSSQFHVYKGFQETTPKFGLFAGKKRDNEYQPCELVARISFDKLPDFDMGLLEKALNAVDDVPEYYKTLEEYVEAEEVDLNDSFMQMYNSFQENGVIEV